LILPELSEVINNTWSEGHDDDLSEILPLCSADKSDRIFSVFREIIKRLHVGQMNFFLLPKSSGINSDGVSHKGHFCLGIFTPFVGANAAIHRRQKAERGTNGAFCRPSEIALLYVYLECVCK